MGMLLGRNRCGLLAPSHLRRTEGESKPWRQASRLSGPPDRQAGRLSPRPSLWRTPVRWGKRKGRSNTPGAKAREAGRMTTQRFGQEGGCAGFRRAAAWDRRELLRLGGVGLLAPAWLGAQARAAAGRQGTFGRARSIILLYLHG